MFFPNAEITLDPVILVLLGVIIGILGGFFGVGGGFLITSGLLVLGVPPLFAVGTGLSVVMGSSIMNIVKHNGMGNVDFKLGIIMLFGTIPGIFVAKTINNQLNESGLAETVISLIFIVIFTGLGLFMIYDFCKSKFLSGYRIEAEPGIRLRSKIQSLKIPPHSIKILDRRLSTYIDLPTSGVNQISVFIPLSIGLCVGVLAGLLGIGGGFILMPLLVYVIGIPTTIAIGTNLFQIIIVGSVGTFLYAVDTHVDPMMVILMLFSASLGSQIGARATQIIEPDNIRVLFGITVLSGSIAITVRLISTIRIDLAFLSQISPLILIGVSGMISLIIVSIVFKTLVFSRTR